MRVWRICRRVYADDPLSGRGGLFASGRWHTRGRPIVYASGSLALSALEYLVNVDKTLAPDDLVRVEIEVPDDVAVRRVDVPDLPRTWRAYPAPAALQRLGDGWLLAGETAVLRVPSSVIPEEANYLLNPAHPDARCFAVVSTRPFAYDPRVRAGAGG